MKPEELIEEFLQQYPDAPNYIHEPYKFAFLVRSFLYYKGLLNDIRRR
jgi:hypothetical protein